MKTLERIRSGLIIIICIWVVNMLSSCATRIPVDSSRVHELKEIKEFDQTVKIQEEVSVSSTPGNGETLKDHSSSIGGMASSGGTSSSFVPVEESKTSGGVSGAGGTSQPASGESGASGTSQPAGTLSKGVAPISVKNDQVKNPKKKRHDFKEIKNKEGINIRGDTQTIILSKKQGKNKKASQASPSGQKGEGSSSSSPSEVIKDTSQVHEPSMEGQKGFIGRKPIRNPFRIGEKMVFQVTYFGTTAGYLTLETKPFLQVNGRKSYNFETAIRTSDFYSKIYSVNDYANVLLDFDLLLPSAYSLHVRESGQLKEGRSFFDHENKVATYWEKKITSKNGINDKPEERKIEWPMLEFSQSAYSAAFYMRVFDWPIGQENAFRIAHIDENLVIRGKVERKEILQTDIGDIPTIVLSPKIEKDGQPKELGTMTFWMTDDERKLIVRIEAKIKIGSLKANIIELNRGTN